MGRGARVLGRRRGQGPFAVGVAVLLAAGAWAAVFGPSATAQNGDAPPPQDEEPVLAGQMIFSDRIQRRDLDRAIRALEAGRTNESLAQLQRLLDATGDSFDWDADQQRLTSVRGEALRILGSLDRDQLRAYQAQVAPDAAALWTRARESNDPGLLAETVRRFFFTAEGFAAADRLATRWLDQGRAASAARVWSSLMDEPAHQSRVTPLLLAKLALARRLSGEASGAETVVQRLTGRAVPLAGRSVGVGDWIAQQNPSRSVAGDVQNWTMFLGDPQRNRSVAASAPLLRPAWSAAFADGRRSPLRETVAGWEALQRGAPESIAVANFPLVLGNTVVVRDFGGIRALDRRSGEVLWNWISETSLAQAHARLGAELDVGRAYAANACLGSLSSDGERVYAVDCVDVAPPNDRGIEALRRRSRTGRLLARESNCLVAISVRAGPAEREPVWSVGGPAENAARRDRLAGHYFFGPPLPLDGRLYALTEKDRQLNLAILKPETGELLGLQELAFVDEPVESDGDRAMMAGSPSFAEGILVCPTQTGLLIGVDVLTGRLLWSYYYGQNETAHGFRRSPVGIQTVYGHGAFPDLPQIHRGRIVYLPRLSNFVHCVDLESGRRQWAVPRADGEEFVGAVTDETVVLVGNRVCRGLSLESGQERWSTPLGIPSGRGMHAGSQYLVPLQDGRVATLDIATGREIGLTRLIPSPGDEQSPSSSGQWALQPGNLLAAGETVLSVTAHGIVAYPQSSALLKEVEQRLADGGTISDLVLATELELNLGNMAPARKHLTAALDRTGDGPERARAEGLLRELLYADLRAPGADEAAILAHLAPLARTPPEKARLLVETAAFHRRDGRPVEALAAARQVAELNLESPLPLTGDRAYAVLPEVWARAFIGQLWQQFGPAELARAPGQVEADRQAALASGDIGRLERFLTVYGAWPQAAAVRGALALRLVEIGHVQRAELLLLANRRSVDPQVAATATRDLARLWDRLGLFAEAAELLEELETRFGAVQLGNGRTGREFVAGYEADPLTRAAARKQQPPPPVRRVAVTETLWWRNQPEALNIVRGYRRYFNLPAEVPYHVLEMADAPPGRLSFVDKETGVTAGHVQLPAAASYASETREGRVGHLLPMASPGALHGVSLLELDRHGPVWTAALTGPAAGDIKIGPAGPSFCAFQARQRLLVVDPADGRILWQRTHLDPECGLYSDSAVGLFGDENVLVIFEPDLTTYTAYRTGTGEELRRGTIELDPRQPRRVFGRKLFYVHSDGATQRMRIWDPLTDRIEFDEPVGRSLMWYLSNDGELVVAAGKPGGGPTEPWQRLLILDAESGTVRLDLPLTAEQTANLGSIRVFSDRQRYYINFQRAGMVPLRQGGRNYNFVSDHMLTATHVQGDLYGVDRASGRILWQREFTPRSFLELPRAQMPFLVAVSRLGESWPPTRGVKPALLVEAVDPATGATLDRNDQIFADRLVRCVYNAEGRSVELHGLRTVVTMEYGQPAQRLPREMPPLAERSAPERSAAGPP